MRKVYFLTGAWFDRRSVVVPGCGGGVAAVAADQTALVDVGVAVNHKMADGIPFTGIQITQFAVVTIIADCLSNQFIANVKLYLFFYRFITLNYR